MLDAAHETWRYGELAGGSVIERRRDEAADCTFFSAGNSVSAEEIKERMAEFYAGNPTRLVLRDFTEIDLSSFSADDVRAIAGLAAERAHGRSGGRTAIVASESVTFGLSRMYQSLLDTADSSVETRIFRNRSEAETFLGISNSGGIDP